MNIIPSPGGIIFGIGEINPHLGLSQTHRVFLLTLLQFSEWTDLFLGSVNSLLIGVVAIGIETLRAPVPSRLPHGLL